MSLQINVPDVVKARLDAICITVGAKPGDIGYSAIFGAALSLYEDMTKLHKEGNKFHMTKPNGEVVEYEVD